MAVRKPITLSLRKDHIALLRVWATEHQANISGVVTAFINYLSDTDNLRDTILKDFQIDPRAGEGVE